MPTQYDRERLRHTVVDQKEPTLEDLNDYITHYPKLANKPPSCRVTYYKAAKLKRNARLLEYRRAHSPSKRSLGGVSEAY